ncbi:MAG: TIGR03960 family B12-binding radical SAM protein [Exilispira sp.]
MKVNEIKNYFNQKYIKNKYNYERLISILVKVSKPARYLGIEPYSIHKIEKDEDIYSINLYKILISYPDLYEIAMSNLTIKYFYYFLNNIENTICERVFLPDNDLNNLLISENLPLFSLESWNFPKEFDLWAFTVQTELTYTNILYMLKLAQLLPLSFQRKEEDPILIMGGVSVFNPLPLAPFIDLFFIGEGEEAIVEIVKIDKINKEKNLGKRERIEKLKQIDGVFSFNDIIESYYKNYYQSFNDKILLSNKNSVKDKQSNFNYIEFIKYLKEYVKIPDLKQIKVKRRIIKDLNKIEYPLVGILPLVQSIQDRVSTEIARGCLNGCRFCQASFIYRPYREKDSIQVASDIVKSLMITGYDECNLSSLSVSDYTNILDLVRALEKFLNERHISLSLPSLRVASFNIDLFDSLKSVRKSGLTFAIEAGCENIRNKINKEFDEEKLFNIIDILYNKGWKLVKLYFIIGFPEIDNEEDNIIDFLSKIKIKFPGLNVNVSIALLIPKPYTPFEFDRQIDLNSFINKVNKIKNRFKNSRVSIKYHDPFSSYLEYFFANGSFDASYILISAYEENVSFDAWDEKRNKEFYDRLNIYSKIPFCKLEKIDLISIFDNKNYSQFIKLEREKYRKAEKTPNCINYNCNNCFICDSNFKNILSTKYSEKQIYNVISKINTISLQGYNVIKTDNFKSYLLFFSKYNLYRFVGHLDFYRTFIKILKIGGIEFEYSKGYNPAPKIFFPFASPVGMESFNDVVLFTCKNEIKDLKLFCDLYNKFLPAGFRFIQIEPIESIKSWRMKTEFIQKIEIPIYLKINKEEVLIDKKKQLENLLEKDLLSLLRDNNIEIIELDLAENKTGNIFNKLSEINFTLILKTELKENQINLVKLLNKFLPQLNCSILSRRIIEQKGNNDKSRKFQQT